MFTAVRLKESGKEVKIAGVTGSLLKELIADDVNVDLLISNGGELIVGRIKVSEIKEVIESDE